MKVYGTSYFPTRSDVYRYYGAQQYSGAAIKQVLDKGGVHVGEPPKVSPSDKILLKDDIGGSRRYHIEVIA